MKRFPIVLLPALGLLAIAAPAYASLDAETGQATAVTDRAAVLNGSVEPSGTLPSYHVEYGPTVAYGTKSVAVPFDTKMDVAVPVAGLAPAMLYHFRVVAKRPDRVARGEDGTFTTKASLVDPGLGGAITDPLGGLPGATSGSGGNSGTTSGSGASGGSAGSGDTSGSGSGDDSSSGSGDGSQPDGTSSGDHTGDSSGADHSGGDDASGATGTPVEPVIGETIGAAPQAGTVRVREPGDDNFVTLEDGAPLADGSILDTRHGSVQIVTAVGDAGDTQAATFHGALFQVRQKPSAGGLTDIVLRGGDFAACRAISRSHAGKASAARARRPVRRLWGRDHHGRFRTHGRGAIATVRGTTWIMADHCNGTRTSVLGGAVSVHDRRLHRTTLVTAGHSYFARTAPH